ncbi:PAS domain-containing protein, partial [Azospirillum brasilense]|nr:PAS domain-containing protein [Azospirillum brasilense]
MNGFRPIPGTPERSDAERKVGAVRQQGGVFVKAVAVTRMPMIVADATLPGNPVIFANGAFLDMSGYTMDEVLGQEPHFLDGPDTDPATIQRFKAALAEQRDETLEILQYRKDGGTLGGFKRSSQQPLPVLPYRWIGAVRPAPLLEFSSQGFCGVWCSG